MMKAYPEYEESGVEWLGKIPRDWGVSKSKYLLNFNMGQSPDSKSVNQDGNGLPFIQGNAEFGTEYPTEKNYCTEPTKICDVGDLLISVRAPVGAMNIANKEFVIGRGLSAISVTNKIDRDFLWYSMIAQKEQLALMETGTTFKAVSGDDLKNIIFALPSLDEQKAIAKGLKKEVGRVDNLIAEKENFINLLKEKRESLISHVITKGLDRKVLMKPSDVEWIGNIPEHWNECSLRRHVTEHRQGYYTTEDYVDDGGVKLLRITDLEKYGEIEASRAPKVALKDDLKNYYLEEGDFVFARTGGAGAFGLVGKLDEPMVYASYLIRFRFNNKICPKFLKFAFQSKPLFTEITKNMHGGVNQNIHAENIKDAIMPFPELSEQQEIANYLESETNRMLVLEDEVVKSIELLKEHRLALISGAVTGKIDVREEA